MSNSKYGILIKGKLTITVWTKQSFFHSSVSGLHFFCQSLDHVFLMIEESMAR